MHQSAIVEIFGTVNAPYLPEGDDAVPYILVTAKTGSGESQRLIAYCGVQVSGSVMPFSLRLDRNALAGNEELTLQAGCGDGQGEEAQISRMSMSLVLNDQDRIGPLDVQLAPVADIPPPSTGKMPIEPTIIPMNLSLVIPESLAQADTDLEIILLRIQEDGESNLSSSSIAGAALQQSGNRSVITLYVDANVLTEDDQLMLYIAQYELNRSEDAVPLAGRAIRNLSPDKLHNIGEITLRTPRQ